MGYAAQVEDEEVELARAGLEGRDRVEDARAEAPEVDPLLDRRHRALTLPLNGIFYGLNPQPLWLSKIQIFWMIISRLACPRISIWTFAIVTRSKVLRRLDFLELLPYSEELHPEASSMSYQCLFLVHFHLRRTPQ